MTIDIEAFVGHASEQGPKRPRNADRARAHSFHDRLAVAVVDGSGSSPEVVEFARDAAGAAVRVAARRTPMLGVLAATELTADPMVDFPEPDGAMVVAVAQLGEPWLIANVGDCPAWGWDGEECVLLTEPHTNGQWLRDHGADEEVARAHDNQLRHSIGRATIGSVPTVVTSARVLVLGSDGLKVPKARMRQILAEHGNSPTTCAKKLVEAAREAGSTDDATALVAHHPDAHPGDCVPSPAV
jgi:PPM family protein phosphatase